jgi:hypothetical protein
MGTVDVSVSPALPRLKNAVRLWQIPILAWFVSRVIGCLGLVVTPTVEGKWFNSFGLTFMDGGWYRIIMTIGYPNGPMPEFSSAWPFAPLYPFVADLLTRIGAPVGPSLIFVSWICALFALIGMFELVRRRASETVAHFAVWTLALLPGAVGQVLSYSDSMFVAALIWTLVVVDRIEWRVDNNQNTTRLWWVVGLLVLVVSASRPNGILILPALLLAVWFVQRSIKNAVIVVTPSLIFVVAWMIYCRNKTGDALAFLEAKNTWLETTILDFLSHPFERPAIFLHVTTFVIVAVVAAPSIQKIPRWWHAILLVLLVPSLLLGVEGMARYVSLTPPLLVMVAISLANWPKIYRLSFFVVAGSSFLYLAINVVRYSWVP